MTGQQTTLEHLTAHTRYRALELLELAQLLDARGLSWQFGASLLEIMPLPMVVRYLAAGGEHASGSSAGLRIRTVASGADLLESLALVVPRWLGPLRRYLQGRALVHRMAARYSMMKLAVDFLDDWPGHDAEPTAGAQKTATLEEAWAQVLAEQMLAVGCETPRVLAAIRAFGLAVLEARAGGNTPIACDVHGSYDDCWVGADLKARIEKLC